MNSNNISEHKALERAIQLGHYPRYVYKYRPINNFTLYIFQNSKLFFSNPKSFNDPFDCQIVTSTDNTPEEIEIFLNQNAPAFSTEMKKSLAVGWFNRPADWNSMINETINGIINNSAICCFAGANDNVLMWSHYTDSHKGICLKFDILNDLGFFETPIIVKYDKEYPVYNHLSNPSKIFECLIQTKAECWNYEKELRVIKPHGPDGLYEFSKEALSEICFGVNTSEKDIQDIHNLVQANNFKNTKFKKAEISKSSFKILINDFA